MVVEANSAGFSGSSDSQPEEHGPHQFVAVLAGHFDNLGVHDVKLKINNDPNRVISKRRMTM